MKKYFTKENLDAVVNALESKGYNVLVKDECNATIITINKEGGITAEVSGNEYEIVFDSNVLSNSIKLRNNVADIVEAIDVEYELATLYNEKDDDDVKELKFYLSNFDYLIKAREINRIIKAVALTRLHKYLKEHYNFELFDIEYGESAFCFLSNNDCSGGEVQDLIEEMDLPLSVSDRAGSENYFLYEVEVCVM